MANLDNMDDVGETLGYYRGGRRRDGLGNFFIGVFTGAAGIIGILLLVSALWPGGMALPFLASPTPTASNTPLPSQTPSPTIEVSPTDATPSATETPSCPAEYTVQPNDSLSAIAARCGLTTSALFAANVDTMTSPDDLREGQTIHIPPPGTGVTPSPMPSNLAPGTVIQVMVLEGDTLQSIADRYNSTVADIERLNNITDPNTIYPGMVIKVRWGIATPVPTKASSPTFGYSPTPTLSPTVAATSTRAP